MIPNKYLYIHYNKKYYYELKNVTCLKKNTLGSILKYNQ